MPPNKPLLAGVARRVISPSRGVFLIGYGDRSSGNIGIHDDLTSTALVLHGDGMRLAIVALDMLAINEFIVDRVRGSLPGFEVLLCCSHTHSGPIAYAGKKSPKKDRVFIDFLVREITRCVADAFASLHPSVLEYSSGQAGIAINRREKMPDGHMEIGRNPTGVVDRSLQVISILGNNHQRVATLINFACHGTVLGPDNLLVSADWIGAMRSRLEADLGGLALFLQGATANLNPDMYWKDERMFEKVTEQGEIVAKAVRDALEHGKKVIHTSPLQIVRQEAWIPTETPVTTSRPPRNYARQLLSMAKLPGWMVVFADLLLNQRYPWKSRIEPVGGFWCVPMRVNTVRLGDLALVTFAAETFTEIGLKIKADSPARFTLFASITDGCISYLHTAASHSEGGYEVDTAPLAYRYPGRLSADGEKLALETASQGLASLWKR